MAGFGKTIFYDWGDANVALFKMVNLADQSPVLTHLLMLMNHASNPQNFGGYISVMLAYALLKYAIRKLRKRGGAFQYLVVWFGATCVAVAAYAVVMGFTYWLQDYMHYARPYLTLPPDEMKLLEPLGDRAQEYRSFPSDHVAFGAMLIAALWPALHFITRSFGLACLFLVCWSQMAMGIHFPADVLYGMVLGFMITGVVRWFVYALLLRLRLKC